MTHRSVIRWHKIVGLLVVLAVLAPLAARAPAQPADPGLVFEALRVLQEQYVDPVDPIKVLNGAIAALRARLSGAGIAVTLTDIPPGVGETEARRHFSEQFAAAVAAAAGRDEPVQLRYAAIRGMTQTLNDSHTGFLTPQQNAERRSRQRGAAGFSGVGIVLHQRDGKFFVLKVIPGSPAEGAGVRDFDRIVRVNDVPTGGLTLEQVSNLVRGPVGTAVTLTLQRPGVTDPLTITITRAPIAVPAIFKVELLEGGVGYLRLYQFVNRTGAEFRAALNQLSAQGMRALVLDLRGNSGGFLSELNSVLNALLPAGVPIYTEMRRGGQTRVVRTVGPPLLPASAPLVVLIDGQSASAAELLAMAVKENRRGQLIGEKTAGAVEASLLIDLSDGSALSVTTFRLASGLGVRLEGVGVEPDTVAELTTADLEAGQDRQLGTAVRIARQFLALQPR